MESTFAKFFPRRPELETSVQRSDFEVEMASTNVNVPDRNLSTVLSVSDSASTLYSLHERLTKLLDSLTTSYEIKFIADVVPT